MSVLVLLLSFAIFYILSKIDIESVGFEYFVLAGIAFFGLYIGLGEIMKLIASIQI